MAHVAKKVFRIQIVSFPNAFYSKQDPVELVWVAFSLNMSSGDKRVCEFVLLCVHIQNNNTSLKIKCAANSVCCSSLRHRQHSVTKRSLSRGQVGCSLGTNKLELNSKDCWQPSWFRVDFRSGGKKPALQCEAAWQQYEKLSNLLSKTKCVLLNFILAD